MMDPCVCVCEGRGGGGRRIENMIQSLPLSSALSLSGNKRKLLIRQDMILMMDPRVSAVETVSIIHGIPAAAGDPGCRSLPLR